MAHRRNSGFPGLDRTNLDSNSAFHPNNFSSGPSPNTPSTASRSSAAPKRVHFDGESVAECSTQPTTVGSSYEPNATDGKGKARAVAEDGHDEDITLERGNLQETIIGLGEQFANADDGGDSEPGLAPAVIGPDIPISLPESTPERYESAGKSQPLSVPVRQSKGAEKGGRESRIRGTPASKITARPPDINVSTPCNSRTKHAYVRPHVRGTNPFWGWSKPIVHNSRGPVKTKPGNDQVVVNTASAIIPQLPDPSIPETTPPSPTTADVATPQASNTQPSRSAILTSNVLTALTIAAIWTAFLLIYILMDVAGLRKMILVWSIFLVLSLAGGIVLATGRNPPDVAVMVAETVLRAIWDLTMEFEKQVA